MHNFYRLIFGILFSVVAWLPASSFASIPQIGTPIYTATWNMVIPALVATGATSAAACSGLHGSGTAASGGGTRTLTAVNSCGNITYTSSLGGCCGGSSSANVVYSIIYSCPSDSTLSGSSCTCNSPMVEDPTHSQCQVAPTPCQYASGTAVPELVSQGWLKRDASGIFTAPAVTRTCTSFSGVYCWANFVEDSYPGSPGLLSAYSKPPDVNGYADVYASGTATATASVCSSGESSSTVNNAAAPPCVGQSGTYNGIQVCLSAETQAQKDARAAIAAQAAASAASAAKIAAGGSAADASAAAAAAAVAAASAIRAGASDAAAAAGGAAAGAAVGGGGTAGANAAAAVASATATANAAALAAGASSATAAAAGTAAGTAAGLAFAAGQGFSGAAAAGSAAGAAIVNGSTGAGAAAAGAGAGAVGAGGAGSGAAPASDMASFCKDNPTSAICKKALDSTWSGACGTAPACSGDAIQCAIAAADFQSSCLLKTALSSDDDTNSVYNKAAAGTDGVNTDLMQTAAHGAQVTVGSFNQVGSGWGRTCPPDPVINISWGTVSTWTLPLSRVCSPLDILARAAVGITLLGSLVWVIGGKKS